MKKTQLIFELLDLFEFKTIHDASGSELVMYKSSTADNFDGKKIEDKTAFEALDSHVHLFNNVKRKDVDEFIALGNKLGKLLLERLAFCFPEKHFVVFVNIVINDTVIIRFHQKWENEPYYYYPDETQNDKEYILMFEN